MNANTVEAGAKDAAKPLDRRSRRTRAMLQNAMLQLLETKPLNKITVTELTQLADVNRATFYAHYMDIYDMFDQFKLELTDTCRQIIRRHSGEIANDEYEPLIREIFAFVDSHERTFSILMGDNGDSLCNDLVTAMGDICNKLVDPLAAIRRHGGAIAGGTIDLQLAETIRNYQFTYLASGIVNVLKEWFEGGRRESIDLMAAIVTNTTRAAGLTMLSRNLRTAAAMDATPARR